MNADAAPRTRGAILHAARSYDGLIWLFTLGREHAFRKRILRLAHLEPGEVVLDVGCGTGSLALEAKRQVGAGGLVYGIDASPEMVARASKKARKGGLDIEFALAPAQALPFPDGRFDIVLITLMLHHLPRSSRDECAREVKRVLKPGGRVLVVDFGGPARESHGPIKHFHRHGYVRVGDLIALLQDAGLEVRESGSLDFRNLQFVRACAPAAT
jgi:ubiquinone/menaquinone biosynthesis C-methylase UbiE